MPPRFAYWTILVDNQPTSFRSSAVEDLLPTFNRLKAKNPSAVMMWFQGGKLWPSRLDAQEAMRARGDMGRRGDPKQGDFSRNVEGDGFSRRREGKPEATRKDGKLDWKPKSTNAREVARRDWKPKPYAPRADSWKPKAESREKPEWKPKGSFKPERREPRTGNWKPKADSRKPRAEKLDWKPKAESREPRAESRPEFRDRKKWRPGGDHQDPRQKYKDAKKAKWTRFKQTIRARSSRPPKKRER